MILIDPSFSSPSMTFAPRTEVYIRLVCAHYKPEFIYEPQPPSDSPHTNTTLPLPPSSPAFPSESSNDVYKHIVNSVIGTRGVLDDFPFSWPSTNDGADKDKAHVFVPRPSHKCTADPEVGRIVAGLTTAVTLTLGILSCITTGYWASK